MNRNQIRKEANLKLEALSLKKGDLDTGLQKTLDATLYIAGEVTNGGLIDLFKLLPKEKKLVGYTNFDGSELAYGRYAVLDSVCIEYATTTDANANASQLDYDEEADVSIKNAEITLVADTEVLASFTAFEAHNPNTTRSNSEKYRELAHLPVIESLKNLALNFETPIGMTPDKTDGKRHFVRVSFRCQQSASR